MISIYRVVLITALAILSTQASAQSQHSTRFEMVNVPHYQNGDMGKVLILDKRTGELWEWSKSSLVFSVGRIIPSGGAGSIARIIHVDQEESGR